MATGLRGPRASRIALGVSAPLVLMLLLSQALLPSLAAKRVSDRVSRYGTVKSASVSAFPALELLWGKADSVSVHAGTLSITPAQIASLLWEGRVVSHTMVTVDTTSLHMAILPNALTMSDIHMEKHGSSVQASATLTQQQLSEALPSGIRFEPVASGGGQVQARASGGLFGVQASIDVILRPFEGRLVAEPQGLPLAGLATFTLFSDSHLKVTSVGVQVLRRHPFAYGLSLRATLR
jgi:hypothetical protein